MKSIILKAGQNVIWGALASYFSIFIEFILPIQSYIILAGCLVACDTITGIAAALKRKDKIISKGLFRTLVKFMMYAIAILLAEGMRIVFLESAPIPMIIAFTISITEFKSNLENIEDYTGTPIYNVVKSYLKLK